MRLCVVTPVGPGHESVAEDAQKSAQLAWQMYLDDGGRRIKDFKHLVIDDTKGAGRSRARNQGVRWAWDNGFDRVFFLDADDLLTPCFRDYERWRSYDAVWGLIVEARDGRAYVRNQVARIRDLETLLKHDPYLTLQMGCFVRTRVALDNPFDEDMDAGEDWDFFLRLWRGYKCIKVNEPFMLNRRGIDSTGSRSADGRRWRESVEGQIASLQSA